MRSKARMQLDLQNLCSCASDEEPWHAKSYLDSSRYSRGNTRHCKRERKSFAKDIATHLPMPQSRDEEDAGSNDYDYALRRMHRHKLRQRLSDLQNNVRVSTLMWSESEAIGGDVK